MEQLKEFQKKIGYQFQQEGLLRQALTHSSYADVYKRQKLSFRKTWTLRIICPSTPCSAGFNGFVKTCNV